MEEIIVWSIISAMIVAILVFLCYMGVFSLLPVDTIEQDSFDVVFANYQGPYRNIDSMYHKVLDRAREVLGSEFIPKKSIYIYYDDPRSTQNQKLLRWSVGIVLNNEEERIALENESDINIVELPKALVLSCIFPYRNLISLGLGGRKAFDAFYAASQRKDLSINNPPMELRSSSDGAIQYIQYIDNCDPIDSMIEIDFVKCK